MHAEDPTFDLRLEKLVYGGEALGRLPDGRAAFVPYALPGERVRVRLVEQKRGFARAELVEILEPSPQRIQPRCAHYRECGGCHYQHIPYAEQLKAKQAIVRDQLQRLADLPDPPVSPAVPSPEPFNYRNHVQFHLTPMGRIGFRAARSEQVIAIDECHLPETPINELWPLLDLEPIPGLERVGLRAGQDDDLQLTLESQDPEPPEFHVDLPLSAVHLGPEGPRVLAGSERLTMEVLGQPLHVTAGAFFQVNTALAGAMVEHLLDRLTLSEDALALDVYCGVGLFSLFLAPRVGRLVGVEESPLACEDFEANLEAWDHIELYQGRAEDVLPQLDLQPDVVVVDPPRAGLDRRVVDAILKLSPAALAYVSCDPATLARDAKRLARGGYRLEEVTPFDLFPQTYHIETISLWTLA